MKLLPRMVKRIQHILLPPHCLLCLGKTTLEVALCHPCLDELPWISNPCQTCAQPLKAKDIMLCGQCLIEKPPHQRLISLFDYDDPIKLFISHLKFEQQLQYAHLFGVLLAEQISKQYQEQALPQLILPVPLHKKRIRQRGFNQALEIARPLARHLQIPINYHYLQRIRPTQAQSDLPAKRRAQNVKNAFWVDPRLVSYKHIAIIDDVMTTGSTLKALVKTIQRLGSFHIDVWTVARTVRYKQNQVKNK